ncbi:MAG: DNA polymerase domain-containing protein, partial [Candidatus Methanosuratincola petrocarbonis]
FFNVIVLDFASLYPSIISRWNLSYETVRCPHPECRSNLVPDTDHWVCTRRVGMMAHVVGLLRDVRVRWFKPKSKDPSLSEEERGYYKVVQQALKVFLNASYGVFGAEIFPLYCLPLADSTTAIGRSIITETIERAKELGMSVLYSDTDSIFLHQPSKDQIKALLSWAESKFGIDLEIDKRYTFVTFSGRKKNYLGVLDSGVVDIKGLMGKKRNTPPFIKNAFVEMTQVLREVKSPQDFEVAKSRIREIVQRCYSDLKARRIPLDDLVFKVMISRPLDRYDKTTPQHVKAAKLLEEKGKEVKPGDLISFVKVQGPLGVKPVQLARIDEVDIEKYVGHIESTFGQVLEALNIDFEEIVGVKRLDFFSR